MFYCNKCVEKLGYPETIFKSVGNCEICGSRAECNDRPSSSLPIPRKTRKIKTNLKLTISISEMKELIEKMEVEHHKYDNSTSEKVVISLCEDTDKGTLVIDRSERVHNLSSY